MKSKKRQIQNILINPAFQLKLLGYFVVLFALTTISLYSTTFLFFYRIASAGHRVGIPTGHVFYKFLDQQKGDLDSLFILLVILNFILLIGIGFLVSHRIAGPIFKMKRYLKEVNSDSPVFTLRKNDFLKDLEPVLNELREKIKK